MTRPAHQSSDWSVPGWNVQGLVLYVARACPRHLHPAPPAPNNQQGFYPTNQGNGHVNNGYNQFGQVAQPQQAAPSGLLQQQRAHIQMRVNDSPMGVSSNPMGGRIRAGAGGGSIDTLSTNDGDNVSINSYGSTGSFNSTGNNPCMFSFTAKCLCE